MSFRELVLAWAITLGLLSPFVTTALILENADKEHNLWQEHHTLSRISTFKAIILSKRSDTNTENPTENQLWQEIWQEMIPEERKRFKNGADLRNHWENQINKTIHIGTLTTDANISPL